MIREPVPPTGVALARADAAARAVFQEGQPPRPEDIYAELRPRCETCAEADEAWDLVLIRLAELQAEADGFPVPSINERAA